MTDRRAWPNTAKDARDRTAELAMEAVRALRVLVTDERPVSETERIRRLAKALMALQEIQRLMEAQGAPVRDGL